MRFLLFVCLSLFLNTTLVAQQDSLLVVADTVKVKKSKKNPCDSTHSPKTATILSAVLPGAGQVYNGKWWKVPFVYAGLGTTTYFIIDNSKNYQSFRSAYLDRLEDPTIHVGTDLEFYSADNLRTISDQYRRRRDLSIIGTALVYVLNVIDANVDGHLCHFDVDRGDLSLNLRTGSFGGLALGPVRPSLGLSLNWQF